MRWRRNDETRLVQSQKGERLLSAAAHCLAHLQRRHVLEIFGSVGRLTRFVLFYSVWCGAVGIIWYSGSAMLRYAKQGIDPDRSERRSQVYGGLSLAVPAAGVYLAYQAALFLETLW
jgi:hypothetical protein